MVSQENLVGLFGKLWRWRKYLIILTVLAAVGSTVISLLLPNYYKSTAIFYPSNIATFDRVILFSTESSDKVLNYFGSKEDVSRMLAVTRSSDLIGDVIYRFNLAERYGIDTSSPKWHSKVIREFLSNYKAVRTELGNIEVSVWDRDPLVAAEMANYIMNRTDRLYTGMVTDRYKTISENIRDQLEAKEKELLRLTDSLASFSDTTDIHYTILRKTTSKVVKDYNNLRTLKDQYEFSANNEFSSLFVIEEAKPADRKSRPVRWLIVVSATFLGFLFAVFSILIFEQFREIRNGIRNA